MSLEAAAAPGGTLAEFAEYHASTNQLHYLSDQELWIPGSSGELVRTPFDSTEDLDDATAKQMLAMPGVRVLTSLRETSTTRPANCILYLCRGESYGMHSISRNARKVIRRGLRNFDCRRCSWDELSANGYPAWSETDARHNYAIRSQEEFQQFVDKHRQGNQFFEAWGAWHDATLAGWVVLAKVGDSAAFLKVCSRTSFLSKAPNNILHYLPIENLINEEKRRYVSTGFSSVQPGAEMGLHDFKIRLGFDPIPVHRTYIVPPFIRPLVTSRIASRLWDVSTKLFPKTPMLRKISGMAQVLSGRQRDPLGWVPDTR